MFDNENFTLNCGKDEKKKKEAGNGPQKQGKNPITDSIESLPDYERTLFAG